MYLCLPTRLFKSLIYQLTLLLVKQIKKLPKDPIISVSPLVTLLDIQAAEYEKLGITAVKLGVKIKKSSVAKTSSIWEPIVMAAQL